jgi:ribonuclease III
MDDKNKSDDKFKSNPYNPKNIFITIDDINNIMKSLNITNFKCNNLSLYQTAFIHKSYTELKDYEEYDKPGGVMGLQKLSYETLEFIGDAFLGNIIANYLYKRYFYNHGKDEGFLTKLKIRFVCGEQLAYLSKCLGFDKYMIISKHIDDNCEGRTNSNILEDTFEAFIGALYHDSGDFKLVERYLINIIEKYVDFGETILHDNNYKDQVLRYLQHNYKVYPNYDTYKEGGIYICKIYKEDEHIETGRGNSKKKSEQDAAKRALIKYCVISE